MEGDDPVRVAEDDIHVVLDLDDRLEAHAPGGGHQDLHDGRLLGGAHAAGGLVQQDDLGPEREGGGHVEELLVALGELARGHVTLVGQPEELGHLERAVLGLSVAGQRAEQRGAPAEPGDDGGQQGLEHGEIREDLHELEAPGEAEPGQGHRPDAGRVAPLEPDRPRGRPQNPGEHVDERGLTRTVGADDRDELAGAHREAHPVERDEVAVELADVARLEDDLAAHDVRGLAKNPMSPPGREDHDDGQDGPEDEPPVRHHRHHRVLQDDEHEGAQHRAEEVGEAAQQRHEHEAARVGPVGQRGVDVADGRAQERPAHRPEHPRDHEGVPAIAGHAHPERFRLGGVVADRAQAEPERRVHDPPHDRGGDDQHARQ